MSGKTETTDTVAVEIVARNKTGPGFAAAVADTKKAEKSIESLSDKMRAHAKEERQTASAAALFTRELEVLTGKGNAAAGAMGNLLGAFMVGGGIGAAMEITKVAIVSVTNAFRKASEEAEKLAQQEFDKVIAGVDRIKSAAEGARDALASLRTGTSVEEIGLVKAADQAREAFEKMQLARPEWEGANSASEAVQFGDLGTMADDAEEFEKYIKLRDAAREAAEALRDYRDAKAEAAQTKEGKGSNGASGGGDDLAAQNRAVMDAAREAERTAAEQHAQRVSGIEGRWARTSIDARKRLELDYLRDIAQLREGDTTARQSVEEGYQRAVTELETREGERRAAIIQELEQRKQQGLNEIHQANEERRIEISNEAYARMEQEVTTYLQGIRSTAIRITNDIMAGQFNAAATLKSLLSDLFASLTKLLIDKAAKAIVGAAIEKTVNKKTAVSSTQGNIASAASGAASAVAGIPIIGPGLALAAAAETTLALQALTAPMLAARGGFDVPRGMNPVTRLHEQEMVLPANIANPLRQAVGDGGGGALGGGTIVVNLSGIDGPSIQRMVEDPSFARALWEARRNGARL